MIFSQQQAILNQAYYFGLQSGVYCYFGPNTANLNLYGGRRPDSECNMSCSGQDSYATPSILNCGGVLRNSLYSVGVNSQSMNQLTNRLHRVQQVRQSIQNKLESITWGRSSKNSQADCRFVTINA